MEDKEGYVAGPVVLAKSGGKELWVSIRTFKGKDFLDIREFYLHEDSNTVRPTKKGVTLPADRLGELEAALGELPR
tara:strand:+ start:2975 stop:3202 length:228 start_codon:yes stop_codon:yes gene_type:complete